MPSTDSASAVQIECMHTCICLVTAPCPYLKNESGESEALATRGMYVLHRSLGRHD